MNERAQRIKKLVEESNKSYQELEKLTGVSKSSLQRYASGVTTKIPLDVVEKLEKAFGVPRGYIMGWEVAPAEAGAMAAMMLKDPDAFQFMRTFMSLSESDRYALRLVAESMRAKKETDAEASVCGVEIKVK